MSKRTRHADNSKRPQPVQQQRAEAARNANNPGKNSSRGEPPPQERRQRDSESTDR